MNHINLNDHEAKPLTADAMLEVLAKVKYKYPELPKQRKELGFEQESLYRWMHISNGNGISWWDVILEDFAEHQSLESNEMYKAYTVAEVLEVLPFRLRLKDADYWLSIQRLKHGGWEVRYHTWDRNFVFYSVQDDKLADAASKMLIRLKEQEMI